MHKSIGRLVICVLTSFVVLIPEYGFDRFAEEPKIFARQDLNEQVIHFEPQLFASDLKPDGTRVSYNTYVSADGVGVLFTVQKHRSATSANNALKRRIRKASKIIERGVKLDKDGRRVGDRVLLLSHTRLPQKTVAGVVWSERATLYSVESSSLKHALEFEKQNYR